ncbi:hypothetical protein V6N13_067091 [Hibiscus sabdariffa]|uniref:Uncharacterized protein n=1 Tax=Hibiscus sabdariffa TaxID=183260 RepID=A0ABR2DSD0_9ROSI
MSNNGIGGGDLAAALAKKEEEEEAAHRTRFVVLELINIDIIATKNTTPNPPSNMYFELEVDPPLSWMLITFNAAGVVPLNCPKAGLPNSNLQTKK